ncbi:ABC transporter ATP-binding protein [Streptomyces sp. NPDC001339]|uniref:ABC transporter ATP-binding protein n=1 Tax=Streptomyces sp. NPDC001339 TaxID=3364563 RepID=UPI0036CC1DA4
MSAAVVAKDLVKRYRDGARPAVDAMSFRVERGEVFGLLGPDGAGKTTAVWLLTTRALPTSGQACVAGVDVVREATRARRVLAVVSPRNALDPSLSVRKNLLFHGACHGMRRSDRRRRAEELLDRMGLRERAEDRGGELTGGQVRRALLARALMPGPRVMFLDEVTTGLDARTRRFVHERVPELTAEGVTVVVTTPDTQEAAQLCDRVGILDRGKLLVVDSTAELTRALPGRNTLAVSVAADRDRSPVLSAALRDMPGLDRIEEITGEPERDRETGHAVIRYRLYTERKPVSLLPGVIEICETAECEMRELRFGKPGLEDVFVYMTGRELR